MQELVSDNKKTSSKESGSKVPPAEITKRSEGYERSSGEVCIKKSQPFGRDPVC